MPANNALDLFAGDIAGTPTPSAPFVAPLLGESVLGIDPSLTGFAVCYSVPGRPLWEGRWTSKPAREVRERVERYKKLVLGMMQQAITVTPAIVLIEHYAFHAGAQSGHHDMAELGGILREKLCELCPRSCPIIEVAPATLKKFACGDGHAKKPLMVSTLAAKHKRQFLTDDAADAFALCQLGLALTGQLPEPSTKAERAYLAGLRKSYGLKEVA